MEHEHLPGLTACGGIASLINQALLCNYYTGWTFKVEHVNFSFDFLVIQPYVGQYVHILGKWWTKNQYKTKESERRKHQPLCFCGFGYNGEIKS